MNISRDYKHLLHQHSAKKVFYNARLLRSRETEAEKFLWSCLRNNQLMNRKFRRQHVFANYIFDFYCHEKKLAIELDGAVHNISMNKEYDRLRSKNVQMLGIKVIRFKNSEVMNNIDLVLQKISEYLK